MKILITAGPTREAIDPVRFISNRSSGKMGYALARAAREHGHAVCLISGPVHLPPPGEVKLRAVITAAQMLQAVREWLDWCDVLVMAAAVSDWRPVSVAPGKLKKHQMSDTLHLEPTEDILKTIASLKGTRYFVGFAAETDGLLDEARRKLREKNLDLIVANDVGRPDAGFEVDTNAVTLIDKGNCPRQLAVMPKQKIAEQIIAYVEAHFPSRGPVDT